MIHPIPNNYRLRNETGLHLSDANKCLELAKNDYERAKQIAMTGIQDEIIARILSIEARLDALEMTKF